MVKEIEDIIGITADDAVRVSAKTGEGVPELLEALIRRIPAPKGDPEAPLQALIVDSWFDNYVGVVSLVRGGQRHDQGRRQISRHVHRAQSHRRQARALHAEVGLSQPELAAGQVGFVIAGIKEIDGAPVGDTLTLERRPASEPLPGFRQIKPRVFAGLFPVNSEDYEPFRDALSKLKLNDSAFALRAGGVRRPGVRLSHRLPRTAAHGHRAGASGARIRARTDHQRAHCRLRGWRAPTARWCTSTTRQNCRRQTRSKTCASRSSSPTFWCHRITWAPC